MELKEIVLYFIDCNAMTIDAKCINGIYLGGITESLSGFDGKINRTISAADFALYVDKAADKIFDDDSTSYRTYFDVLEFYRNIYSVILVYEGVISKDKDLDNFFEVYRDDDEDYKKLSSDDIEFHL